MRVCMWLLRVREFLRAVVAELTDSKDVLTYQRNSSCFIEKHNIGDEEKVCVEYICMP